MDTKTKRKKRIPKQGPSRGKTLPYTQGNLQKVIDLFFAPLLRFAPSSVHPKDFLELLFGVGVITPPHLQRTIDKYYANNTFYISAWAWAPGGRGEKLGVVRVADDSTIFVRIDGSVKTYVDFEVVSNKGPSGVYKITMWDWEHMQDRIRKAPESRPYLTSKEKEQRDSN